MSEAQRVMTEIELMKGSLRLAVCPSLGGAITRLSFDGIDLLRPWDGSDSVRRAGCFVLAPFSNRVADGAFEHEGCRYSLRSLSPEHSLPIHGVAWKRAWQVLEQGSDSLVLSYSHRAVGEAAQDWPFDFDLEHRLQLTDEGVTLRLSLRNVDRRSMPAGLGWHPYFLRHDACELGFSARAVWENDARNLPARRAPVPASWDFSTPRPLGEPALDNCFVGREGPVSIRWPGQSVALRMEPEPALDHLVVFTPPADMGFFAVEPVTHANNALGMDNPDAHGMRTLGAGEVLQVGCRLGLARIPKAP